MVTSAVDEGNEYMEQRFTGKSALVTGAASGIGRATAIRLAAEGAQVFAHDVTGDGLAETASAIEGAGGTVLTRAGDLTSKAECDATVAAAVEAFGQLDVLGNIAGISRSEHVLDVSEEAYRKMMAVNVDAPFFVAQAAIPRLLETSGSIINIASNAGLMGSAYTVVYCMSKGAVVQLTRALAMEFLKTPLRVNAIAPGGVDTPMTANWEMAADVDWDLVARYMNPRPMGSADHIATLFAFLASDESRPIHGAIVSADNGLMAG
jgi:meso-butanediol dehydrogenase/(S,S)-butanediol dehydrogenase/diacetyl reductase